jgi:hypothetical protein
LGSYRERYNLGLFYAYKWSREKLIVIQDEVLYIYSDASAFASNLDPIMHIPICGCRPYALAEAQDGRLLLVLQNGDVDPAVEAATKANISAKVDSLAAASLSKEKKASANAVVELADNPDWFRQRSPSRPPLYRPYATAFTASDVQHPAPGLFVLGFTEASRRDALYALLLRSHRRHSLDVSLQCLMQLKQRDMHTSEGIFRISGSRTSLLVLARDLSAGRQLDVSSAAIADEHVLAGLVKHVVRGMAEPALGSRGYEYWAAVPALAEAAVEQGEMPGRVFARWENRGDCEVKPDGAAGAGKKKKKAAEAVAAAAAAEEPVEDADAVDAFTAASFDPNADDDDRAEEATVALLRQGLRQLSPHQRALVFLLTRFAHDLLPHHHRTRMDARNLALVLGVNLVRAHPSVAVVDVTANRMTSAPLSPAQPRPGPAKSIGGGAQAFMGGNIPASASGGPAPAPTVTTATTPVSGAGAASSGRGSVATSVSAGAPAVEEAEVPLETEEGEVLQARGTSELRRASTTGVGAGVSGFFSGGAGAGPVVAEAGDQGNAGRGMRGSVFMPAATHAARGSVLGGPGLMGLGLGVGGGKKQGLDELLALLIERNEAVFRGLVPGTENK